EAETAIADHHRGDAVPRRQRAVRIPEELRVVVRVQVDEARRHDQAAGVDHLVGIVGAQLADLGDHPVLDAKVALEARQPAAVDDHAAADHAVEAGHDFLLFRRSVGAVRDSVNAARYVRIMKTVRTDVLEIAYLEHGPLDGPPVILLHGFPYDAHAYDEVAPPLASDGCHVLIPWLRGYGATRFLKAGTPRSGEQAALGNDLRQFMNVLGIQRAALAGYDWGGRAACVAAALWP